MADFYTVKKTIDGREYLAQFGGIALAAEMSDASADKNGNFSIARAARFVFDKILVEPAGVTMDDFEDMDTLVEVVQFCQEVANGRFRRPQNQGAAAPKG